MEHLKLQDEASIRYPLSESRKLQHFGWRFRVALCGVAVNLIIVAMFAAFFSSALNDLYKEQQREVFVSHLTIDTQRLSDCPNETGIVHLPCLMKNGGYLTSHSARLGPWRCPDQAVHCPAAGNGNEIVITENGVYMVAAQTMVVDSLASPVTMLLSVNDKVRRACSMNSTSSSRSACSVSMLEGLRVGDRLTVGLPDAYRQIDPHGTLTYVDLVRLGGSGERKSK